MATLHAPVGQTKAIGQTKNFPADEECYADAFE